MTITWYYLQHLLQRFVAWINLCLPGPGDCIQLGRLARVYRSLVAASHLLVCTRTPGSPKSLRHLGMMQWQYKPRNVAQTSAQTGTNQDARRQPEEMLSNISYPYIIIHCHCQIAWSCLMFTLIYCTMYYNTKKHLRTTSALTFAIAMNKWTLAHCKTTAEDFSRTIQLIAMQCMLWHIVAAFDHDAEPYDLWCEATVYHVIWFGIVTWHDNWWWTCLDGRQEHDSVVISRT